MKSIFSIIALAIILTSCNDGISTRNGITQIKYMGGETGYKYDDHTYVDSDNNGTLDYISYFFNDNLEFITAANSDSWESWQGTFEQVKGAWKK